MSLFQTILSGIKAKLDAQEQDTTELATLLSTFVGIPITASQLTIKKGTLYINAMPTMKMAILIKKELLLTEFKNKQIPIYAIA